MQNIVYLPIGQLHPHPDNPRKVLGDLTEIAESIKAKGVLQNLTVVRGHWEDATWMNTDYTIVIGHRRRGGAELAGLTQLPCAIVEMTHKEQVETMLLENMQRSDLTPYEQAQGFQMMIDMGATAEEVAEKTGFSATTVRRRLEMAKLDQKTLHEVSDRQISMADFDKLTKIEDISIRNKCLKDIGTNNFNSAVESEIKKIRIRENTQVAKQLVKELQAKKLNRSDTWNGKYDRLGDRITLSTWDGVKHPVKKNETRKIYYSLEPEYNELSFYVERPKAKPVKRSKAEIEREKQISKAHSDLAELNALHYKLRQDFVADLQVNSKNVKQMLQGACVGIIAKKYGHISYQSQSDAATVAGALGLTLKEGYDPEQCRKMLVSFEACENWTKAIPVIIYAIFNDQESANWNSTYKSNFPMHYANEGLDALYKWLCTLGYEMSDDELALQNGTHELLNMKESANEKQEA